MWLRRAFFSWLLPAAAVLPAWLLLGWILFGSSGWSLVWVLLIAIPSVLIGQLILTMLVRARGTVRHTRTVSWADVIGFGVWHLLTIGVGFFNAAFWPLLIAAIVCFIALVWSCLWQLFQEARPTAVLRRYASVGGVTAPPATEADVIVITEHGEPRAR